MPRPKLPEDPKGTARRKAGGFLLALGEALDAVASEYKDRAQQLAGVSRPFTCHVVVYPVGKGDWERFVASITADRRVEQDTVDPRGPGITGLTRSLQCQIIVPTADAAEAECMRVVRHHLHENGIFTTRCKVTVAENGDEWPEEINPKVSG